MPEPESGSNWATIATVITSVAGSLGLTGLGAWLWKIWRQQHTDTSADHLGTIAEYRQLVKDQRVAMEKDEQKFESFRAETRERDDVFRRESDARYDRYQKDAIDREDLFRKVADERFEGYRKDAHSRIGALTAQINSLQTAHRLCERENAMLAERVSQLERRLDGHSDPKKTDDAIPKLP